METIKLKILASDILETDYNIDKDCAITRALKRANVNMTDVELSFTVGSTNRNESYRLLVEKVMGMYGTKDKITYSYGFREIINVPNLKIEDFEHEIIFNSKRNYSSLLLY